AATRRGRATRRTSLSLRARAVLRRLRAPVERDLRSRPPRSRTEAPTTRPLTAMLRRTPTDASSTTRLEPPYDTNGSGIPVRGAMPITADALTAHLPPPSRGRTAPPRPARAPAPRPPPRAPPPARAAPRRRRGGEPLAEGVAAPQRDPEAGPA